MWFITIKEHERIRNEQIDKYIQLKLDYFELQRKYNSALDVISKNKSPDSSQWFTTIKEHERMRDEQIDKYIQLLKSRNKIKKKENDHERGNTGNDLS